jgi:hypothetical protein
MPDLVPDELTGLWRREVMIRADGGRDTSTRVLWLQTRGLFADIRIPGDRPKRPTAQSFADYDDAELVKLAAMYGFAGSFAVEGSFCRWLRSLDYQPPGGPPDEADCRLEGDLLIELGSNYREDWRRETPPGAPVTSFTLEEDDARPGRVGLLVLAGDHFIQIQDRPVALPEAPSLAGLVSSDLAAGARDRACGRLAMKIAYGRIAGGWEIALATFPWLETTPLFAGQDVHFADGVLEATGAARQRWRLVDTTLPAAELSALFPRSSP